MFYQGTLQEGISTAVGQQKLVFCFVTNENDESQTWENEFLQDDTLKDVIAKRAVALRLTAGSEEAGYLAQIFPLPQTPTIVIMKHGELKEYIAAGTTKEDFLRRVQNSFDIPHASSHAAASTTASQPSTSEHAHSNSSPSASSATAQAGTPSLAGVPSTIEQSDNVRRVLQDRAAKQEAAKRAAEKKAAADELARQQKQQTEKNKKAEESTQKQAELVKKKKKQESDERKRILKRIQDDKEERRKLAQERELQRLEGRSRSDSLSSTANISNFQPQSRSGRSPSTKLGEHTSIQVRLFDGSTIRSRFKTASPVKHVRQWVDEARTDGSMPYALKQLLTPLPNRPIDDTEEDKSLGEVGLFPSSTLILVPIHTYVSAYSGQPQGIFSRLVSVLLWVFTWLSGLLGVGGSDSDNDNDKATSSARPASPMSPQSKEGRVRGFENPNDGRRDHQLYNGNSLNFEPRPDDDEKK
ncbi:hypothetical protein E4U21_003013 [Claviceps maximensis]|nr:hypothetical protein E4U21_003013 [Claviceps maximensis]